MSKKNKIVDMRHPFWTHNVGEWAKYRAVFNGGQEFINDYLERFSRREDAEDFRQRKAITYAPAHAKAAIMDVKNAIYQRMFDITREGGPVSYQRAVRGELNGVDLHGSSMNAFIGSIVLPELVTIGAVGAFVDNFPKQGETRADLMPNKHPYIFKYPAEDVLSWSKTFDGTITALLLRDHIHDKDEETGLIKGEKTQFRLMRRVEEGVQVDFLDEEDNSLGSQLLELSQIPFYYFAIDSSLLRDAANYQISLLNLASSDMTYALKSNYPFYVEQYHPQLDLQYNLPTSPEGTQVDSEVGEWQIEDNPQPNEARTKDVNVGTTQGRRYPKGVEAPSFIHPSAEPLRVSMEKQDVLKREIRQLMNLALATMGEQRESAESKEVDQQGLEAGLAYIGMELQHGEKRIAEIWAEYEDHRGGINISYPENYSLRSESDKLDEAERLLKVGNQSPSISYRRDIAKRIINLTLGNRVSNERLKQIHAEIDETETIQFDSESLRKDVQSGLVGEDLASRLQGYPTGEVTNAREDHAARIQRIQQSQSSGSTDDPGSRGVEDLDQTDGDSAKAEKTLSQDPDTNPDRNKRVKERDNLP